MSYRASSSEETRMRDTLRRLLDDVSRLNRLGAAIGSSTPTGTITAYAGSTAPAGWALCDGATYDGTTPTYAALWAVVGTTYGGTGQAAFNVPDLRGRAPVGVGTNADVSALGASDGLAVASRSPKHNSTNSLTLPNHTHADSISFSDTGHSHPASGSASSASFSGRSDGASGLGGGFLFGTSPATDTINDHWSIGISVSVSSGNASLSKSGSVGNPNSTPAIGGTIGPGGSRPTDTPAYLAVNYIVKL